jgi:hypothetical protein
MPEGNVKYFCHDDMVSSSWEETLLSKLPDIDFTFDVQKESWYRDETKSVLKAVSHEDTTHMYALEQELRS